MSYHDIIASMSMANMILVPELASPVDQPGEFDQAGEGDLIGEVDLAGEVDQDRDDELHGPAISSPTKVQY